MRQTSIYDYIKAEESNFQTDEIQLGSNWFWNFRKHVELIFHLKNGIFFTGDNNWLRAFKNIMEPMLNLAYWTEDIDVKDVVFFMESENGRALSFLVKKYHDEVYVRENDIDTLFDEITESDLDYGGVLVQGTGKGRPEVLALNSIAFCDQTDIEGNPIAFKHYFSPDKLRQMDKLGWGNPSNGATISLNDLALLATNEKDPAGTMLKKSNKVPGKAVEVYIVRGSLPESFLKEDGDSDNYVGQLQVVAFYTDKDKKEQGVTLYRKTDDGESLRFHTSKKVHGRALGRGVGESLLHPQVWTNFMTIHKMAMLEAAAKVPLVTDDPNYTNKNRIQDMQTLELTVIEEGKTITQVPTAAPANIQLFEQSINEWFAQAQLAGSAQDPLLGKEESAGSTFRGQERLVAQGRGSHDRRRGQRAKFIEVIYRDFILPQIVKEICKGQEFMGTLTAEEMGWVIDQLATHHANRRIVEATIEAFEKGKPLPTPEDVVGMKQTFKELFSKGGNRHFFKILKDEFSDVNLQMGINVAGKQKDLVSLSDKLLSIIQNAMANPVGFQQAMQIPALQKAFADILEFSGISQVDFATLLAPMPAQPVLAPGQPQPQPAPQPPAPLTLNAPAPAP